MQIVLVDFAQNYMQLDNVRNIYKYQILFLQKPLIIKKKAFDLYGFIRIIRCYKWLNKSIVITLKIISFQYLSSRFTTYTTSYMTIYENFGK